VFEFVSEKVVKSKTPFLQQAQIALVANTVKTVNQHADTVLMMNHVTTLMAPVLMAAKKATRTCRCVRKVGNALVCVEGKGWGLMFRVF
jgi:hypothetical protein